MKTSIRLILSVLIFALVSTQAGASSCFDYFATNQRESETRAASELLSKVDDQSIVQFFKEAAQFGFSVWDLIPHYPGQTVFKQRTRLGDPGLNLLIHEMGWTSEDNGSITCKNPKEFLRQFFSRVEKRATELDLKESDLVLPAITLTRKIGTTTEVRFFRVGIDRLPSPNEGWKREEILTLDAAKFTEMIANGYMLIDFQHVMKRHDFGHLLDILLRPEVAAEYRRLQNLKLKTGSYVFKHNIYSTRDPRDPDFYFHLVNKVDEVLNEFLYFPLQKNASKVKKLFGISSKDISKESLRAALEGISVEQLLVKAKSVLRSEYLLYEPYGGGTHDESIQRFMEDDKNGFYITGLERLLDGEVHSVATKSSFGNYENFLSNESVVDLMRMNDLIRYLERDRTGSNPLTNSPVIKRSEAALYAGIKELLVRVQFRTLAGLQFRISPLQVMKDTQLMLTPEGRKKYVKSPTFRYYKFIAESDTSQYRFFVEPFESLDH